MYYRKKETQWVKSYKPDDIAFTMLEAMSSGNKYWPDELLSDNVVAVQIINNSSMSRPKIETTKQGKTITRNISQYISIRLENIKDDNRLIKLCESYDNFIDYMYHVLINPENRYTITFRFEITKELLDQLT